MRPGDTLVVSKRDRVARVRSRVGGRPRSLIDKDLEMAQTLLANPDIAVDQVATPMGASPATLYREPARRLRRRPCPGDR